MPILILVIATAAVAAVASQAAIAAKAPASCPSSVPISTPHIQGWTEAPASVLYLNSAAPTSGPPGMRGDLSDFTSKPGKIEWSYAYKLDRLFPHGKWLECGYGPHNELTLSKQLPDDVKSCIFTYRKGAKAGQVDIKIRCE